MYVNNFTNITRRVGKELKPNIWIWMQKLNQHHFKMRTVKSEHRFLNSPLAESKNDDADEYKQSQNDVDSLDVEQLTNSLIPCELSFEQLTNSLIPCELSFEQLTNSLIPCELSFEQLANWLSRQIDVLFHLLVYRAHTQQIIKQK